MASKPDSQQFISDEYRQRLNEYGDLAELSITQIAEELGFARGYVSQIMSGKITPGPKFCRAVDALLDAKPVIGEDDHPEPEAEFHPKVEELLLKIMDLLGFESRRECLAALIREKASELQHATAPQSSTQKILSDAEKTIAKAQEEAAKARKELGH